MSILEDIAREEEDLKMTPMIDVTFLLLIFFLLTIQFRTLEGKLAAYLPKNAGAAIDPRHTEKVDVTIRVVAPGVKVQRGDPGAPFGGVGSFDFRGRKLQYQVGPHRSDALDTVGAWLDKLGARAPEAPLTIDCRSGTVYGDMVPVLDAVVAAGFTDITFIGAQRSSR